MWYSLRNASADYFVGRECVILQTMTTATLLKKAVSKDEGVVVLSLKEYDRLLATHVPNYYLTGKAATDLDKLVEEGLREYAEGKTIHASSISEALAIRRKQGHKKK